jgi:type II secretory pathway component PulF
LIESGLSSLVAYKRTVGVIVILPLRIQFQDEIPNLNRGLSFGQIFTDKKLPSHIAPLLLAGEASGNLGNSLIRCAHILDHDIDHILKRLTALIEPILMAGMGCVVGAIALSIMLPIYDISRVLQK